MYDSFTLPDGRPVLVLELCSGSLAQHLAGVSESGALPAHEAVAIAAKLAGALETAHRGGVLHRDVRPENVLITAYGEPALSEFGVSRLRSAGVPATAELFDFPGPHVAPELLLGQEATAATDVYGLASLLYQLLAGLPPMAAYAGEMPSATILRILRDPARPIDAPEVPYALSDLLLWALAKDPAQRPPSAAWFAEELGRIEARNGWSRTPSLVADPAAPVRAGTGRRHAVRLHRPGRARVATRPAFGPPPAPAPLQPTPVARMRAAMRALLGRGSR
jgi:serine/threonine-protein kinase PknK